jgi:hypothetical protein
MPNPQAVESYRRAADDSEAEEARHAEVRADTVAEQQGFQAQAPFDDTTVSAMGDLWCVLLLLLTLT